MKEITWKTQAYMRRLY